MNVPLSIVNGGEAAIVENQGDHVVVHASVASPPGSTLRMQHGELAVLVKVRGCRRLAENRLPFRIEGRLVSFTRMARDTLFGPAASE
jgi:hypothetical protein